MDRNEFRLASQTICLIITLQRCNKKNFYVLRQTQTDTSADSGKSKLIQLGRFPAPQTGSGSGALLQSLSFGQRIFASPPNAKVHFGRHATENPKKSIKETPFRISILNRISSIL